MRILLGLFVYGAEPHLFTDGCRFLVSGLGEQTRDFSCYHDAGINCVEAFFTGLRQKHFMDNSIWSVGAPLKVCFMYILLYTSVKVFIGF